MYVTYSLWGISDYCVDQTKIYVVTFFAVVVDVVIEVAKEGVLQHMLYAVHLVLMNEIIDKHWNTFR